MSERVAVIGLGYVGLQLAAAFAREAPTLGFDTSEERIQELRKGHDRNGEVSAAALASPRIEFTTRVDDLPRADAFVVAVPTPVDRVKRPDLGYLRSASGVVARALVARGARAPAPVVVYESTVYPGCTEEVCVPIIESASGLRCGVDFHVAYSPERINPGDPAHGLADVVKIVAAQDPDTLERVAALYGRVVRVGVHRAPDIRTAEAAKVIENTQRDLNIALMNELAILFHKLGMDTGEVLKAARTKWNFLPFEPGLVGGHCIPEDPYYLTHKAAEVGYYPEVILAGRRINDRMGAYVALETVRLLSRRGVPLKGARVLVLGAAFKEGVPDVRNTRVVDLVRELELHGATVAVHDPVVGPDAIRGLGLEPSSDPAGPVDVVVVAVAHPQFRERGADGVLALLTPGGGVVVDVKGILPRERIEAAGAAYWRL